MTSGRAASLQCVGGLASGLFKVVVAGGAARVCVGGSCVCKYFLFSSVFRRSYGFIPVAATTIACGLWSNLLYLLVLGSLMVDSTPLM